MSYPQKKLKVAVIGPKGQCGSCVVDELLSRGHSAVGISRNPPPKWAAEGDYTPHAVDLHDTDRFAQALSKDYDAIVCAYGPPLAKLDEIYEHCVEGHAKIKEAVLQSTHSGGLIIIGGAGSLHTSNGKQLVETDEFAYSWWYGWPEKHLEYMTVRATDHGAKGFATLIRLFKWARNNVERPGWLSWILRPFARLVLWRIYRFMVDRRMQGLITGSRIALNMWLGVRDKKWSFLSPPGLLRDKGIRTGEYEVFVDSKETPAEAAVVGGIYNEDMAVAIVDEVEKGELAYKHWSCTGPIDVKGQRW